MYLKVSFKAHDGLVGLVFGQVLYNYCLFLCVTRSPCKCVSPDKVVLKKWLIIWIIIWNTTDGDCGHLAPGTSPIATNCCGVTESLLWQMICAGMFPIDNPVTSLHLYIPPCNIYISGLLNGAACVMALEIYSPSFIWWCLEHLIWLPYVLRRDY